MTYPITGWEEDVAGKWRIYVDIKGRTAMFKFDEWPDDNVVQAEAARFAALMREQANAASNSE
jgi:hypothetical protein